MPSLLTSSRGPRLASRALLLAIAACTAAACVTACSKDEPPPAGGRSTNPPVSRDEIARSLGLEPRGAVAGFAGFRSRSRLTFVSAPERTHELETTYLFPGRVRFALTLAADGVTHRVLLYRAGERGFALEDGSASSKEITGDELAQWRLQTELRRALFLWPEGVAWSGEGRRRTAEVAGAGRLEAELGDDGRPTAMASFALDGTSIERLDELAWSNAAPHAFPARFALSARGAPVWTEEVLAVELALDFVDAFFFPPDRRPRESAPGAIAPRSVDLESAWELRVALPSTSGTPSALLDARAAALAARDLWRSRGIACRDAVAIELDIEARPVAAWIEAPEDPTAPSSDWRLAGERPGWSFDLTEAAPISSAAIRSAVTSLAPSGGHLRILWIPSEGAAPGRLLLVAREP